jgi:hypothetical protein
VNEIAFLFSIWVYLLFVYRKATDPAGDAAQVAEHLSNKGKAWHSNSVPLKKEKSY